MRGREKQVHTDDNPGNASISQLLRALLERPLAFVRHGDGKNCAPDFASESTRIFGVQVLCRNSNIGPHGSFDGKQVERRG
jgi:hypothetical protein